MDLKQLTNQVIEIARNAGQYIKSQQKSIHQIKIQAKGVHNYVTEVDKNSEVFIVRELKRLLPESGFIAEEGTASAQKGEVFNWIVDPLDGTTNFIHGLMPVAVSIALQQNGQTVLGVVYEIGSDEMFYAYLDGGAFLNGEKIQVTRTANLDDTLLATGFPFYDYSRLDQYMQLLKHFMKVSHGLRRLGSAATDLVYVACGRFDGFFEYSLSPWDVAAGAFIVEQAGGKIADFQGGQNWLYGREIIASNPYIFDDFVKTVRSFMYQT